MIDGWKRTLVAAVVGCLAAGGASATGTGTGTAPAVAPPSNTGPRPTAKELYIGCYLLTRDTDVPLTPNGHYTNYSAANCGAQVLSTMTFREGNDAGRPFRFCLPNNADIAAEPAIVMARAYLDFYERKGARLPATADGSAAFIVAMVERWPCPRVAPPKP